MTASDDRPGNGSPGPAGEPTIDLAAHHGPEPVPVPEGPLGICCSGGGIRSAAFNLGALQSLDEGGVLRRARYLSAVSGGSYITSAFAVATRYSDPRLLARKPAFAPGSPEEHWVRNRCSYLADGLVGKVRLLASVLVGVLANVTVLALFLVTVLRPLGWAYGRWQESLQVPSGCGSTRRPGCFRTAELANVEGWVLLVGVAAGVAFLVALVTRMFYPPWQLRRRLNRLSVAILVGAGAVALVTLVLPGLVVAMRNLLGGEGALDPTVLGAESTSSQTKSGNSLAIGSSLGLVAVVVAAAAQLSAQLRPVLAVGKKAVEGAGRFKRLGAGVRRLLVTLVGGLIGPLAVLAGAVLILNDAATRRTPSGAEVAFWAAVTVLTLVVFRFADVTSWSMHPFYKRRLASAFAVRRRADGEGAAAEEVPYSTVMNLSGFPRGDGRPAFPELLVCAAANVSDPGATPPGSDVVSFVFSPSSISMAASDGTTDDMPTAEYEDRIGKRRKMDVTLPAAVAMSGAAISPSMGKMTRPALRFLLALANVRLGVWLPNPRRLPVGCKREGGSAAQNVADRLAPANPRPYLLVREILGLHSLRSRYIYVSDGGHYENLGLLELVRRRCRTVVCFDAAGGSPTSFTTLGEAVALVRAELNVEIDIDPKVIRPEAGAPLASRCTAVGTIRYPDGTQGSLVYVKAAVVASDPWDVLAFAEKDKVFPSHPTASQLYTGERFEAYRALGAEAGAQALDALSGLATGAARPAVPAGAG